MQRLTSRYVSENEFVDEVELNKEEVFFCTKSLAYNNSFVINYTQSLIYYYDAIEFESLKDLEKS
jgi:hypothetical protein